MAIDFQTVFEFLLGPGDGETHRQIAEEVRAHPNGELACLLKSVQDRIRRAFDVDGSGANTVSTSGAVTAKPIPSWQCSATTTAVPDSESQAKARSIMGKNFLGLEEVRRGYGIALDPEQLTEVPFSEETLQACKDTHVLVAGAQPST